jgi:hypothetical protein
MAATQMPLFVGDLEMNDEEIMERLRGIYSRFHAIEDTRESNMKAAGEWITKIAQAAFTRLQSNLRNAGRIDNIRPTQEPNAPKPTSRLRFNYSHTAIPLTYAIELDVSAKGVVGHTSLTAGKEEIRATSPVEDILGWTEDDIFEDFLRAYTAWQPVK